MSDKLLFKESVRGIIEYVLSKDLTSLVFILK